MGKLEAIPLHRWEKFDHTSLAGPICALEAVNDYSIEVVKAMLLYGLPNDLRLKLLSRCSKSTPMQSLVRTKVRIPGDYAYNRFFEPLNRLSVDLIRETILGVMAIGLHRFLSNILCCGGDSVKGLLFPDDPSLCIPLQNRLALGVVREAIILHHFPSLNEFWLAHERMRISGQNQALYPDPDLPISRSLVTRLLIDDTAAMAMYNVMMDIGFSEHRLQELNMIGVSGLF